MTKKIDEIIKKKDEGIKDLLKMLEKKEDKFWEKYFGEEATTQEKLDEAMAIMNLQKGILTNLLLKINLLNKLK